MSENRPKRLLFVCSGNICRSPMAEVLAADVARRLGRDVEVASAGTLMIEGRPADPHAVAVCAEIGVDLAGHASQGLTAELIAWADHVLVMELAHAQVARERGGGDKVVLLGTFGGVMEVADPIGGFRFQFRRCRDEILRCVEAFVSRL